jgi:phosphohistidine phosphatase SixA
MPTLIMVRHADAGERGAWVGPDAERPLTDLGRLQAQALVLLLGPRLAAAGTKVHASPTLRCVDTVAPLATHLGTTPLEDPELFEGSSSKPLMARIRTLATDAVWSTHGDLIPSLLIALADRGVQLASDPKCAKAGAWELRLADGRVQKTRYHLPPL